MVLTVVVVPFTVKFPAIVKFALPVKPTSPLKFACAAVIVPVNVGEAVPAFASNCVWTEEVTPSKYPNSVSVTSLTAIFCDPLEITALFAVKDSVSIVVAEPVIVACLASNCVWIAEVTPSTYPNSVAVSVPGIPSNTFNSAVETVAPSNISNSDSVITALPIVKLAEVTPPVVVNPEALKKPISDPPILISILSSVSAVRLVSPSASKVNSWPFASITLDITWSCLPKNNMWCDWLEEGADAYIIWVPVPFKLYPVPGVNTTPFDITKICAVSPTAKSKVNVVVLLSPVMVCFSKSPNVGSLPIYVSNAIMLSFEIILLMIGAK